MERAAPLNRDLADAIRARGDFGFTYRSPDTPPDDGPDIIDDPDEFVISSRGNVRQAGAAPAATSIETPTLKATRRAAEGSLFHFAKIILGLTRLDEVFHRPICDWLQTVPPYRKCLLLPRDFLKTSMARALVLHLIIQPRDRNRYFPGCHVTGCLDDCREPTHRFDGRNTRILYAGEIDANAEKQLRWIRAKATSCVLLRALWPEHVWTGRIPDDKRWSSKALDFPRTEDYPEATLESIGVGGAIASRHYNVLVKDDLATLPAARSRPKMDEAIEWNEASRALMDDPDRSLEFGLGTRWGPGDVWATQRQKDPTIDYRIRAIIEDGVPTWPAHFGQATVDRLRREEGNLFPYIRMNTDNDPLVSDFRMSDLRVFRFEGEALVVDPDQRDDARAEMQAATLAVLEGSHLPRHPIYSAGGRGRRFTPSEYDRLKSRGEYIRLKYA